MRIVSRQLTAAYLRALSALNLRDVARLTGRGYRTLQAYRGGDLQPSAEAVQELIAYLRQRSKTLTHAADTLEAAQEREAGDG